MDAEKRSLWKTFRKAGIKAMIIPNKHMDLETSVLNISATILSRLVESSPQKYDELFETVVTQHSKKAKYNFFPALYFLFLLKKINYLKNKDEFEVIV